MADPIYTAEATARGDGRNGEVTSSDGVIDETLAVPKEMGGPGGQLTNPEQLFAAGYAACFHNAVKRVASEAGTEVDGSTVTARVGIGKTEQGTFALSVTLETALPGLEEGKANELVAQAHQICPYSTATRGNIAVEVTATI
ncbi:organic hydroperoxide resistance protein [Amycolatopsis antarctica]|uniref:Organic hydroperoxide resistance protein n=1 Tax=Amycolatopsis antarctica TaxID=1854586 RepID=A0A263D4E9_9PSEU|nr:organic hydroperoxide resistance protein [Amycolatopsis antarctica]OZM73362.1 organic hydroperoxide resistance protein [Amycolatopsis antarctica]